jgi:glucokinase
MWHDYQIRRELAATTGLPVDIETAGRALALAELWHGESSLLPAHEQQFATLVLGDDADGGLVVGGRLAQGLTGNLGQFGHLIVEPEGMECACGAIGCLAAYASVRGIESSINRELRRTPAAIVERTGIMTARACASIAAILDVSDIVVGGIVPSVFGAPFFDALAKELDQRSRLASLSALRVRGVGHAKVGPLVAAAAVARHAQMVRADDTPPDAAAPSDLPTSNPGN